eukprot:5545922-Heterocapsa_arctica.AAC.1
MPLSTPSPSIASSTTSLASSLVVLLDWLATWSKSSSMSLLNRVTMASKRAARGSIVVLLQVLE